MITSAPVAPGDVLLGKYRVESILGQGGMGVVVAARHIELGELFAIKFLLPQATDNPQAVERFVREARASAKLKGEHVAKVHDVGRLPDGLPYMVLEHLSGQDLKKVIRERNPLPITDVVTYMLQACEAIAEAHAYGIVHRDIKPANMFLTRRINGTPCVKVLDFGISKQLELDNPEQHGLTQTGMLVGSPSYMAPEQMLKTKETDPRSDIWSLGCVLYELLTGRIPYRAEALIELVGKVLQEEPEPPSVHRTDIPPAIEAVVMRCLVKRKEDRYQTVNEIMEALRYATGPGASAASPMRAVKSTIVMTPGARLSASNEAAADDHAAGISAPNSGPSAHANTAPGWGATSGNSKLPAQRRNRTGMLIGATAGIVVLGGGGVFLAMNSSAPEAPAQATSAPVANTTATALTPEVKPVVMPVAEPSAAAVPLPPTSALAKSANAGTTAKSPSKQQTPVAPTPAPVTTAKSKPSWGE